MTQATTVITITKSSEDMDTSNVHVLAQMDGETENYIGQIKGANQHLMSNALAVILRLSGVMK